MSTLRTFDYSQWIDHVLHFDLTGAHPDEEHWLHVNGKKHPLEKHTPDSLAEVKSKSPHLLETSNETLTHYTPNKVKLPHDQTLRIQIKHSLKNFDHLDGKDAASHAFIYIPPEEYTKTEHPAIQAAGGFNLEDQLPSNDKKVPLPKDANPPVVPPKPPPRRHITVKYGWSDAAKALLFHHPDLMTRDPKYAKIIFDHMDSSEIATMISNSKPDGSGMAIGLADRMQYYGLWPTSPHGGWYKLNPVKIPTITKAKGGTYNYDEKNLKTVYQNDPIEAITNYAGDVMTALLVATKNDHRLKGKKWRASVGESSTNTKGTLITPKISSDGGFDHELIASGGLEDWTPKFTNSGEQYGLVVTDYTEQYAKDKGKQARDYYDQKRMVIKLENHYVRYLSVYVAFLDADGKKINLQDVGSKDTVWMPNNEDWTVQTSTLGTMVYGLETIFPVYLRYVDIVDPRNTIMGVAAVPYGENRIYLTFPEGAVKAEIYGCGLGTGANPNPETSIVGGVLTGVANLAIPTFMMGFAVTAQSYKPLYKILGSPKVLIAAITTGFSYFSIELLKPNPVDRKFNWKALTSLISIIFTKGLNKLFIWMIGEEVAGEAEDEIPFAGWIMVAVNIAANVAQMATTIVDIAESPFEIKSTVSTSIKSTLTVYPDPRHHGAWPASSGTEKLSAVGKMIYQHQTHPTKTVTVDLTAGYDAATFGITFDENVLGGKVKFEVDYYIDDWIAGKASSDFIENDDEHAEAVTLYLVEIPKPINAKSVFEHASLLTYQGGKFDWKLTADYPTTLNDSDNSNEGNAISEWVGLALSQRYASLGMSWKAANTGLKDSKSGKSNTQLYAFQNINVPGRAMDHAKFTDSGFTNQAELIYDPYPQKFEKDKSGQWKLDGNDNPIPDPKDKNLGDYFIDPRRADDPHVEGGGYHLRKVNLGDTSNFAPNQDQSVSHGRFPFFPDHQCMHPSGHMVAVNQKHGKIMILKINEAGAADDLVPLARHFSGTAQNTEREGLLFQPIAVACSSEGTILILDSMLEAPIKTVSSSNKIESSTKPVTRIQAFDLLGRPVKRFHDAKGSPSPFLNLPTEIEGFPVNYLDMVAVGTKKMTYMFVLYRVDYHPHISDPKKAAQFSRMSIYQYGTKAPNKNPLVTTNGVAAARLQVDMWHTMFTLNYAKLTDGTSKEAGPPVGSGVGTYPSASEWLIKE